LLEPNQYEASLRQAQIETVIVCRGLFRARVSWAELHDLQLWRCEEDAPRVAYMHVAPRLALVTFPACAEALPVWRGVELRADEIMFHSPGERLHQRTPRSFIWSVIATEPTLLEHYGRALFGKSLPALPEGRILQPARRDMWRLRRLHARACRFAETKCKMLAHSEVAQAIQQDLIHALVTCLTSARARADGFAARHHASIMARFEEVLAERLTHPPNMPELCELVGVSDGTLRSCCAEFLGMSPIRYISLRRLREARGALREADPDTVKVAEIAHRFGFAELGRFAGTYRATFGETPSTTLRRIPGTRFAAS
jgi:AraC-like DNA-binding protein